MSDVIRQLARETEEKCAQATLDYIRSGSGWPIDHGTGRDDRIRVIEAALLHAQQVQREQEKALIEKWRRFAKQYHEDGDLAATTLELCANELAALRSQEIP